MSHPPATVVIGGTIAIDHVKTPVAEAAGLLGGSAAYAALAASFFRRPVELIGVIGRDFPQEHLDMLENHGVSLAGVERSDHESFTWSGEYHANMNERTTHHVGINVLEDWRVRVPAAAAASTLVVLANMSPDNQLEMLAQCGIGDHGSRTEEDGRSRIEDGRGSTIHDPRSTIHDPRSTIHDPQSKIQNPKSNISSPPRFVIADTMDLWIEIANPRLHEVLPYLDLFVLNEAEARELSGTSNLVRAGRLLLEKGPRHVVIKLGEFGAILFSANPPSSIENDRGSQIADHGSSSADASALPSTIHNPQSIIHDPQSPMQQDRGSQIADHGSSSADASALPSKIQNPKSKIASASEPPGEPDIFRCSAWPLESVADPTGAGDTFLGAMAGYLAALGPPPYSAAALRQALIQGAILASFTCEAFSTRRLESLQPADLETRLQQFRLATLW